MRVHSASFDAPKMCLCEGFLDSPRETEKEPFIVIELFFLEHFKLFHFSALCESLQKKSI